MFRRYLASILLVTLCALMVPSEAVFAQLPNVQSASLWQQIIDLFSPQKTQTNVQQLGSLGEPAPVETPKLSFGDYLSARWEGVTSGVAAGITTITNSISGAISGIHLPSIGTPSVPAPTVPASSSNPPPPKAPAPAVQPPASVSETSVPAPQTQPSKLTDFGSVVGKSFLVGLPLDIAAYYALMTTSFVPRIASTVLGPHIISAMGTEVTLISIPGAALATLGGTVLGGAAVYLGSWPFGHGQYFGAFGDSFRASADHAIVNPVKDVVKGIFGANTENVKNLAGRQINQAIENPESLGGSGAVTIPTPTIPAVTPVTPPAIKIPTPSAPAVSSAEVQTLSGRNLHWAGTITKLTYARCLDSGVSFGPYATTWKSDLVQDVDVPELSYSGNFVIPDFDFNGKLHVVLDETKHKLNGEVRSPYVQSMQSDFHVDTNPAKSYINATFTLYGNNNPLHITCASVTGALSGAPAQ